MARSPSVAKSAPRDCFDRAPRRTCRCPSHRRDRGRDRPILSRIQEQIDFRSYQSFGSLDTQLISSLEGPQSPESTYSFVSHDNSSSVTSSTADLEEQRHISPPFVATPASSDASFTYLPPQYFYAPRQEQPGPPSYPHHSWTWPSYAREGQSLSPNSSHDQSRHVLAGIDHISYSDEAARLARQRLEFVSSQGPSPVQHQLYPKRYGPWNTQSLRQEDLMVLDQQRPHPSALDTALSPTSSSERGSRRNGPLSAEARRNANIVRQIGACRRCVYMKEPVQYFAHFEPIHTNSGSAIDALLVRTVRAKKEENGRPDVQDNVWTIFEMFFFLVGGRQLENRSGVVTKSSAAPIANRHSLSEVNKYIENTGFWYLDRAPFKVKLETGSLSRPLEMVVKEIESMDTTGSEIQAFKTWSTCDDGMVKITKLWNPPLVPYMTNKHADVKQLRAQLKSWMEDVFEARHTGPDYQRWPWPCFEHDEMNWEGEVVEAIQSYYRSDLASHALLQKAQSLLFFGYILDNSFLVSGDSRDALLANLQNRPPAHELGDKEIAPETITRFIKMIVCGYAFELSQSVLTGLQELLHGMAQGKETSNARSDLAFCITFLLLVFLGQSQNRILMLAELSKSEPGINLSWNEAESYIHEMEHTLGSYMIHFHEFAVKRRKHTARPAPVGDADEHHALDRNLMGDVAQLFSKYCAYPPLMSKIKAEWLSAAARPASLELASTDININVFGVRNTHRLCWRFVSALFDR